MKSLRWTSRDVEMLPDDGKRYEVVDGELYISKQPHYHHQLVCSRLITLLNIWSSPTEAGEATYKNDTLQSPNLPGFTCQLSTLFANI